MAATQARAAAARERAAKLAAAADVAVAEELARDAAAAQGPAVDAAVAVGMAGLAAVDAAVEGLAAVAVAAIDESATDMSDDVDFFSRLGEAAALPDAATRAATGAATDVALVEVGLGAAPVAAAFEAPREESALPAVASVAEAAVQGAEGGAAAGSQAGAHGGAARGGDAGGEDLDLALSNQGVLSLTDASSTEGSLAGGSLAGGSLAGGSLATSISGVSGGESHVSVESSAESDASLVPPAEHGEEGTGWGHKVSAFLEMRSREGAPDEPMDAAFGAGTEGEEVVMVASGQSDRDASRQRAEPEDILAFIDSLEATPSGAARGDAA